MNYFVSLHGQNNKHMKKIFLFAILLMTLTACQESIEKRLEREAREISEKGPQSFKILGQDGLFHVMVRDSVVFHIPTLTQRQYFKMTGDIDQEGFAPTKQMLVEQLKNEPSYRVLRENGYSFYYIYRSAKDPEKVYAEITITKQDYQR